MSTAAAPGLEDLIDNPAPAWLWDVDRHKIAWGNHAALQFWGEVGLLDLIERDFDPSDVAALQIARLTHEHEDGRFIRRFEFDMDGERRLTTCQIYPLSLDDGRPGALLLVEQEEDQPRFTRFGEMVQEAPLPLMLFSDDGRLLHQNSEAETIFGDTAQSAGLRGLLPDGEETLDLIARTVRSGTLSRSVTLTARSGPRPYRLTLRRVVDPETRSHALLFVGRDIGDRRAIETLQSKRSTELQTLLNHVSDFQWRIDANMRFTRLTGRFEETLGIQSNALLGKSWSDVLTQFDLGPSAALTDALRSKSAWRDCDLLWRVKRRHDDKTQETEIKHLSLSALPLLDGDGTFTGWNGIAVVQTVPEHKSLSAPSPTVRPREDYSDALLDTTYDGVLMLDGAGKIVRANEQASRLFGECVGQVLANLIAAPARRRLKNYLDSFDLPADEPYDDTFGAGIEISSDTAPQKTLLLTLRPLGTDYAGASFTAIVRDISQLKDTEAELRRALNLAKESNAQKSDFLASIAHELRTPLNAIIGFSEVMRDERFGAIGSEKYLSYAADIHESGTLLLSLINDLLDLSKIEAGKFEPQFEQVDVAAVIEQCVNMVKPAAADERIAVRTQIAYDTPHLVADKRSLIQILLNLLSNAVKFTSAGGQVTVSTHVSPEGDLTVSVQDTGIGMSEEDLDRAFVPFGQARNAATRKAKGTGLGLPLSKALTTANRGALKIETSPGNGTLVELAFPSTQVLQD